MSPLFSRRDRAPEPVADDGDLRRAQRRVAAARAGIWLSVVCGPLSLAAVVTVVPAALAKGAPVAQVAAPTVIAPPTGYAELFVDLWLRSSQDGEADALHAMAPAVDLPRPASGAQAAVQRVVAVRSTPMGGRTWQVTVAATMTLPVPAAQGSVQGPVAPSSAAAQGTGSTQDSSAQAGGAAQSRPVTVRYFAVPIAMVRASGSGGAPDSLAVTAAPAQVAAPAGLSGGDPAAPVYGSQIGDGALQQTVIGYLTAYLTGVGDSSRYLSPGAKVPAPGASYAKVEVAALSATSAVPASPADGAVLDVQAQVRASDAVGTWPLTYPLRLRARAGRWEIAALAPVSFPSDTSSSPSPVPSTSTGVH